MGRRESPTDSRSPLEELTERLARVEEMLIEQSRGTGSR
jgi:hypothetical protein